MMLKTFPDTVKRSSKIYHYIDENEIDEKGVFWCHKTISDHQNNNCIANKGCWDVSKQKVMRLWEHATGVDFEIDPQVHKGIAVEKSNNQYTHDGRIVKCPTLPKAGKVYQKFIDSSVSKGTFSEYRIFYHWGVDFIMEKIKPKSDQWGWKGVVKFYYPEQKLSDEEIKQIVSFSGLFGLDFGEIDAMRDKDGQLYVIDVNNISGNGSNVFSEFPEAEQIYQEKVNKLCLMSTS